MESTAISIHTGQLTAAPMLTVVVGGGLQGKILNMLIYKEIIYDYNVID